MSVANDQQAPGVRSNLEITDSDWSGHNYLSIARCVLETETPLSLATGNPDGVFDTALVTDANNLPAIPGSSVAGVLRHLWGQGCKDDKTFDDELFGFQRRGEGNDNGKPSRVAVSWGAMLDANGLAVEGILAVSDPQRENDVLVRAASDLMDEPVFRNRVSLTDKGGVKGAGKCDRAVLPAGYRFAIEIRVWSAIQKNAKDSFEADAEFQALLNLTDHPLFRLGGGTRTGLGKLSCVTCHVGSFNMTNPDDIARFRAIGRAIDHTDGLMPYTPQYEASSVRHGTLSLEPTGLWRIGQGVSSPFNTFESISKDKPASLLPVTEGRVRWSKNGATHCEEAPQLLIPASSIKGVLRHRFLFHAYRRAGYWVDPQVEQAPFSAEKRRADIATDLMFGCAKGDMPTVQGEDISNTKTPITSRQENAQSESGFVGALFFDDAYLSLSDVTVKELMHNSIDRFTGGVRDRVLYKELSIYKSSHAIKIPVFFDTNRFSSAGITNLMPKEEVIVIQQIAQFALQQTLNDLSQRRLAFGSRTTTGNGFFEGMLEGFDERVIVIEDDTLQTESSAAVA